MPEFSDFVVYADESGDHGLSSVDPQYPVFVLNFCVFDKSRFVQHVVPAIQTFKFRHFGHDLVVLHEHEIRRQVPPFVFLKSEAKRERFMEGLNTIIRDAPFTAIAAVIDKERLRRTYRFPDNPYDIALRFCLERTYAMLRSLGTGQVDRRTHFIFERRGKVEDSALELTFRRVCDGANQWGPMPNFEIVFADKRVNSSGLQLADLTARPIGLRVLRPTQANRAFDLIEPKFRRSPTGKIDGWGLKTFP